MSKFLFPLLALLALSGCASMNPKAGESGEKLVFVVDVSSPTGSRARSSGEMGVSVGGTAGGYPGAFLGVVLESLAISVKEKLQGPTWMVTYQDFDPRDKDAPRWVYGRKITLKRSPWTGVEQLLPRTWAILSEDENGETIVVPCPQDCTPRS